MNECRGELMEIGVLIVVILASLFISFLIAMVVSLRAMRNLEVFWEQEFKKSLDEIQKETLKIIEGRFTNKQK